VQEKFDASGRLADEKTRGLVQGLLVALQKWALEIATPRA
jgi:hypothetical protein